MKIPKTGNAVVEPKEPEKFSVREALLPPSLRALRAKLSAKAKQEPYSSCECCARILTREPDAGNLHVRFDEGEGDAWEMVCGY
jgi:hypothetical protein